jgi:hypothetical protein
VLAAVTAAAFCQLQWSVGHMPDNYRYEHVSGVLLLDATSSDYPNTIDFFFANRGGTVEVARAVLYKNNETMMDSGDRSVDPGGVTGFGFVDENPNEVNRWFWARIFTTSINIVPSVRLSVQVIQDGQGQPPIWQTYIAPRDFAVFELPYGQLPPMPPIDPVLE